MLSRVLPLAAGAALLLTLSACGSSGSDTATDAAGGSGGAAASTASSPASAGSGGSSGAGPGQCSYPADPNGAAKQVDPPPANPTEKGTEKATVATSVGTLHFTLDGAKTPCTVNSFVSLARQGFFDGTSCHRLGDSPGFHMLQCGDPTGTGAGGPGYTIPDEITGKEKYPAGTLAMANTGAPNTGGSQFFMVFGDTQLPPSYTVFGSLDAASVKTLEGVAKKGIANPGQDGTGAPAEPVKFTKVTIS